MKWLIENKFITLAVALVVGIFILDLLTPLGIAVWLMYQLPLMITAWTSHKHHPLLLAATCTVLAVAGYFVSPSGIDPGIAALNRSLGVGTLWVVALLITQRLRAESVREELLAHERAAKDKVHAILESISDAFVSLDTNWCYTYMNKKAGEIFGRKPEDMIGKHIWTEFPEGVGEPFHRTYEQAMGEQKFVHLEEYYPPYDRWFENRIYPSKDGLSIFFHDITDRRKAEKDLERRIHDLTILHKASILLSEPLQSQQIGTKVLESLEQLLDWQRGSVWIIDQNTGGLRLLAHSDMSLNEQALQDELSRVKNLVPDIGVGISGWVAKHGMSARIGNVKADPRYVEADSAIQSELCVPLKVGGRILGSINVESFEPDAFDENDELLLTTLASQAAIAFENAQLFEGIQNELNERKRVEEELDKQNKLISALVDTTPALIYVYDMETQSNVYSNRGIERLLHYTPDDMKAIGSELFARLIHPDDLAAVIAFQTRIAAAADEDILEIEYRMRHADGRWFTLHSYERPFLRNKDGSLKQKIGAAFDVTEHKLTEEKVRAERDFSNALLKSLPGVFYMIDMNKRLKRWNQNFEILSGYKPEELATLNSSVFFRKDQRHIVKDGMQKAIAEGNARIEVDFVARDGRQTPIYFTGIRFEEDGIPYMLGIGIDITERKRLEDELKERENLLRLFVEYSPAAIAMFDREMKYIVASRRYLKDYDIGEQDVAGRSHYEIFPEITDRWKEIHQRCLAGATERTEEDPFPRASGKLDWVRWEIRPWYEHTREVGGIILFSEVITERKRAEEEAENSREQLRALTARLQEIREEERTRIAREIHDELGQSLTALKMDLSWCSNKIEAYQSPLLDKTKSMIDLVNNTVRTVRRIATELRPGILDDLGLVAAIEWQAGEFQSRSGIRCTLTAEAEDVVLDESRTTAVFRIFQESLTNVARHSGATHVDVHLKKNDGFLTLEIRDNGKGISQEEVLGRQSLGLLGMRERALIISGELTVTGIEAKGTTVRVTIPVQSSRR